MARLGLCALAGAYAMQLFPALPGPVPLACLAAACLAALIARRFRPLAAAIAGFVALAYASGAIIDDRLNPELAGTKLRIAVRIGDFPKDNGASLTFAAEPIGREDLPRRLRLSWFDAPAQPSLGEIWEFELRLRRPRGFANPGGFDYEGWLFRQRIGATGYVSGGAIRLGQHESRLDRVSRLRQRFVDRIRARLPDDDGAAVLMAIGVGARHAITAEQWNRYAVTGTSHLMAISGLHIGLAAGGVYVLAWVMLALIRPHGHIRDRAALIAAFAAFAYAEVSGFAVPARRALLMAIIVVLTSLARRQASPALILAITCLGVLFSDPVAILSAGFKLSFAAVAILIWHLRMTRRSRGARLTNALRRLVSLQFALLFGLMPLTALVFDRVSAVAPVVNLVALPIFNFVTVPACLLGLLLDGPAQAPGDLALDVAHRSVATVLWIVRHAAELPFAAFHTARPRGLVVVAFLLPSLWAVLPPGWPGRKLAPVAALAAILYRPDPPPPDCLDLHVLDVGQGLAVVLRTQRHTAVFDAGPSFRGGADTGRLVLVPFLRNEGVEVIDVLIVSHADQDHAGGAASLIAAFDTRSVLSGELLDGLGVIQERCETGQAWTWDGIDFAILHPRNHGRWQGNNASCVLQIRIAAHTVVVSGDIESPVEHLLARDGALTSAEIVLIPHHGSRTSSSPVFVSAVRPKVAIVSAGFGNRWGFPKEDIVAAWRSAGAVVLNTATSGAISYRICRDDGSRLTGLHRRQARRYWHE